jgi:hypothetical protein
MKSEGDVLRKFAGEISERILRKTISELEKVADTLSSDDSGLINAWEEICVQIQHEYSFFWDLYDQMMWTYITSYVEELKKHEKLALWFQTNEGCDWLDHIEFEKIRDEYPPIYNHDIVQYVVQELHAKAANWSNRRIDAYLGR